MTADETRTVDPTDWVAEVTAAKESGFAFFDWLTAVDRSYEAAEGETGAHFDLTCRLLDVRGAGADSLGGLRGIRLTTRIAEVGGEPAHLASLTGVYAGAAFHERETFEMFGIVFDGFADANGLGLRQLLLAEGFVGNPWRKDFQLGARASKAWPGGKEPGEGHGEAPSRRRVQAPGVPPPEWGPR